MSESNLVERSSTARGRGRPKKVLHERVLDLTAAVVFPGSRSSYPLISNRTKNVSLAQTMMMMVAVIIIADDYWIANNDNDEDKQSASRCKGKWHARHQPAIGSSLYTIVYSSS